MEDGCFHNAFVTPLSSQPIYEWFAGLTLAEWVAFSLAGNFAIFGLSVMMCAWIGNQFGHRRLFETRQPVARGDLRLALTAVLLNSLVAIVGWLLWKAGWIRITHPAWWRSVLDVVIFLGAMDFGMYVFHRLAHHRWIYPWIHSRHHTHESVNAISLFVLGMSIVHRARASLFKSLSMASFGLWIIGAALYRAVTDSAPDPLVMSGTAVLALGVNVGVALLLYRYRVGDSNMRSIWLCSRNDAIGNLAVIFAAAGVFASGTRWPDLAVATLIAGLNLWAALQVTRLAMQELQLSRRERDMDTGVSVESRLT